MALPEEGESEGGLARPRASHNADPLPSANAQVQSA
jgi:hypothetical protein